MVLVRGSGILQTDIPPRRASGSALIYYGRLLLAPLIESPLSSYLSTMLSVIYIQLIFPKLPSVEFNLFMGCYLLSMLQFHTVHYYAFLLSFVLRI